MGPIPPNYLIDALDIPLGFPLSLIAILSEVSLALGLRPVSFHLRYGHMLRFVYDLPNLTPQTAVRPLRRQAPRLSSLDAIDDSLAIAENRLVAN